MYDMKQIDAIIQHYDTIILDTSLSDEERIRYCNIRDEYVFNKIDLLEERKDNLTNNLLKEFN